MRLDPTSGLLVAACVNRAPQGTFGAAVAEVGVLDLLRVRLSLLPPLHIVLIMFVSPCQFHKFTIGKHRDLLTLVIALNLCYRRESLDERLRKS